MRTDNCVNRIPEMNVNQSKANTFSSFSSMLCVSVYEINDSDGIKSWWLGHDAFIWLNLLSQESNMKFVHWIIIHFYSFYTEMSISKIWLNIVYVCVCE